MVKSQPHCSAPGFQDWQPQAPTCVKKQGRNFVLKVTSTSQTNTARSGQQTWSRSQRERAKSLNIYSEVGINMVFKNVIALKWKDFVDFFWCFEVSAISAGQRGVLRALDWESDLSLKNILTQLSFMKSFKWFFISHWGKKLTPPSKLLNNTISVLCSRGQEIGEDLRDTANK